MSRKVRTLFYFYVFLFVASLSYSQQDTILVDFGSVVSIAPWNNFTDGSGAGEIQYLKNSRDLYTGVGIHIYDRFNGINTGGTTSPDPNLGYPSSATSDSYFGNTAEFSGLIIPKSGLLISGLNPSKEYTIEVFASRNASDNRETKYKFEGLTLDSVYLNPSNNTANTVSVTMQPKADGSIDLTVSPGPNNNNSYGFFYLGALKIIYEQEDVLPPSITLTAPNGGEELFGGTNFNITWFPVNLLEDIVVSYSTDSGSSWDEIATVASTQTMISWNVPDISSSTSLVKVVSGTASDQSDSVFTIISSGGIVSDTIMVDFGSVVSDAPWNNFTDGAGAGEIQYLKNSRNLHTGVGIQVYDRFNGINTGGTTMPDPNLGYPSSATSDSYYGNTVEWSGLIIPSSGLLISGLNPAKEYTMEVFASRNASDNRETKYRFEGLTLDSVYLNPSNNTANTVSVVMQPKSDGTIDLRVSPGPNNNNSYGFFYLGALKIIYEQEDVFPPSVTVISPNGGEEWGQGTTKNITWLSNEVRDVEIEFSANGGTTWDNLGTVSASDGSFEWLVPDIDTDSALVKISAVGNSEISDVSDNFFKIGDFISMVTDTILIDFGSTASADPWNNFTSDQGSGSIQFLRNSKNLLTGIGCNIYDRFNNINLNGTTNPDPNLGLPSTATSDSYYGNTNTWLGLIEPTAGMMFSGLDTSLQYTFEIFASRMNVTDNRETKYKFIGKTTDSLYLNAANNETQQAVIALQPAANGTIDLIVSAGENNTNSYKFYYLNSLRMIYEYSEVLPPSITVISPNGGEEWYGESTREINWISTGVNIVRLEYSVDNGNIWTLIVDSLDASVRSYTWMVPNIPTTEARIKITDVDNTDVYDVSDDVFTINEPFFEITILSPNGF